MRLTTGIICLAHDTSDAQPYTAKIERSSFFTCDLFPFLSRPSSSICIPHTSNRIRLGQ
jgi:hypothetical protein